MFKSLPSFDMPRVSLAFSGCCLPPTGHFNIIPLLELMKHTSFEQKTRNLRRLVRDKATRVSHMFAEDRAVQQESSY